MKTTKTVAGYSVKSCNFDWHDAVPCASYSDAIATAKSRGWEARIEHDGALVAVWSPLYGTRVYDRALAA
jgi:hypothetical protein